MPGDTPYIDPNDPNMGSQDPATANGVVETAQLRDLNEKVASEPEVQAFLRRIGPRALTDAEREQFQALVTGLGYSLLPNTVIDPTGAIVPKNHDTRNLLIVAAFAWPLAVAGVQALAASSIFGAGGGAGAATTAGASTAGAAGATGAAVLPSTATVGVAALPTATGISSAGLAGAGAAGATGAGAAGASGAAAATGNAFTRFAASPTGAGLIGTGVNLLGSYLQTRANSKATSAELQAQRDALDVQAQMYDRNMGLNIGQANQQTAAYNRTGQNLTPYRNIGANSLSMLGFGMGLPGYETGNRTVVNPAQPWTDIPTLETPPPLVLPGQPTNPAQVAATWPAGSDAQPRNPGQARNPGALPTQNASSVRPPTVGDRRYVNGQQAEWDGTGWRRV